MQHILVVDDDPQIREMLQDYLGGHGFRVSIVASGEEMLQIVRKDPPDLILLDLNLPGVDGLSCARKLRAENGDIPIIMLTGRDTEVDRIVGLEVGADDYVGKPFNLRELLARINAVLRRTHKNKQSSEPTRVSFLGWEFMVDARRLVSPEGEKVPLTNTEFSLLMAFIEHPQRVLSRDQLLEYSRRRPDEVFDRAVDYSIMQLRRKLELDAKNPQILKTERGAGYIFTAEVTVHS